MRISKYVVMLLTALALCAVPAVAVAGGGNSKNAPGHTKTTKTTSSTTAPKSTKAYGHYCATQGESKTHVAGQKGTPFSQCVTALAHAAKSSSTDPKTACKSLSKKHVAGQKGTPFADCVSAVKDWKSDAKV